MNVRPAAFAVVLVLVGLTALYWDPLRTPFLNDDFLFLEEARTRPFAASLTDLGALGNYYRPLSRQVYFEALTPLSGGDPLVFHLVNFALFVGSLALLADLLRVLVPPVGVLAGCFTFAVLPFQWVNLTWVSCSQDLMALAGSLGALALFRRGRHAPALAAFAAALMSKESALPLPAALVVWGMAIERRRFADAARRAAPYAALAIAWGAVVLAMRARHAAAAPLEMTPGNTLAALVHGAQSVLGLDHPHGFLRSLFSTGPALVPLACFIAVGWGLGPGRGAVGGKDAAPAVGLTPGAIPSPGAIAGFSLAWFVAFALPVAPVAYGWSAYHYTIAAVGAAVGAGALLHRLDRWGWIATSALLLWWHAAATGTPVDFWPGRSFAVEERAWTWTSHLTPSYFRRAAALTDSMSHQLRRLVPEPEPHTRFFFATLPPYAGFQMGNGALIRALYRDTTLASHFYSQFSESLAGRHPCRFLFWNGQALARLYPENPDRFFQVGGDLLLLDRPRGASWAFVRGLSEGGNRLDLLYWLGWAELWSHRRERAEAAWKAWGARDDSLYWMAHLRAARNTLEDRRDTVEARRHLVKAVEFGMGRPDAHAVLGPLLLPESPKYGLLELKVAGWLNPADWLSRRELALGLLRVRLAEQARHEITTLLRDAPNLRGDTVLVNGLRRRGEPPPAVVEP